mmetsp:Transcript_35233/g.41560  ORF Transcript_35233/g.41560 Transcript_35233/m.41560 type:complete len:198 (-) Transcript_35233:194-787(-)
MSDDEAPQKKRNQKVVTKKKVKDPNAPKGAKTAYIYFCDQTRAELKVDEPELTFGEVGKKLGSLWGALDQKSKAPFVKQAAADKARFDEEMADYTPPDQDSDDEDEKKSGKKKAKKDPNAPKRPMSSYFLWIAEVRESLKAKHPDASLGEFSKILGAKWKTLSDREKAPFVEQAATAKENYTEALKRYKGGGAAEDE